MNPKIAAIVPMRHSSERVPGKNYRNFSGLPLYQWIVECLLESDRISEVVIDTDSPIIMEQAKEKYPSVTILKRPDHLVDGNIPMNDVLINCISQINADFFLQTHSTNPLLRSATVSNAIDTFLENHPIYDCLFSVTRRQARYWDELARAVNHNPRILLRTQDLPPIYEENSCLYIFTKEILLNYHNRIGVRPYLFEIDPEEAQDIDVEIDFKLAEFLNNQRLQQ